MLNGPLDKYIARKIYVDTGAGVEMQCAREYWSEPEDPQATRLFNVTEEERERTWPQRTLNQRDIWLELVF